MRFAIWAPSEVLPGRGIGREDGVLSGEESAEVIVEFGQAGHHAAVLAAFHHCVNVVEELNGGGGRVDEGLSGGAELHGTQSRFRRFQEFRHGCRHVPRRDEHPLARAKYRPPPGTIADDLGLGNCRVQPGILDRHDFRDMHRASDVIPRSIGLEPCGDRIWADVLPLGVHGE